MRSRLLPVLSIAAGLALLPAQANAQSSWPTVFDPAHVETMNLEIDSADWDTIRHDTTNEIEVAAQFAAGGDESPILVSVRRKSSRALPSEADPRKVGLKVDINEFVDGQSWRGLLKLSLENGSDTDPVSEGLAWNLHEMATGDGYYGANHHPGLASWVKVYVNGEYLGVYVSVEQRDKQFLRNRGIFSSTPANFSWLYEIDDINGFAFEVGGPAHSPTFDTLCYSPFVSTSGKKSAGCPTPNDATLATQLPTLIDMPAMLTQGAVDAFSSNGDALFSHGKNYFFADFAGGSKRMYFPWDLDAAITTRTSSIYGKDTRHGVQQTAFQSVILNHPVFRQQYNDIMLGLTDPSGPLSEATVHGFLDSVQPALADALAEDPYQPIDASQSIAELKQWLSARIAHVRAQVAANQPTPRG
jgi:spore coat protein CotH